MRAAATLGMNSPQWGLRLRKRGGIIKTLTDIIKGQNTRCLTQSGFSQSYTDDVPSCFSSPILMPESVKDHFTPQSSCSAAAYTWGINISKGGLRSKNQIQSSHSPWSYFRLPAAGPTSLPDTPTVRTPISHNFLMTFSTDFPKRVP